MIITLVVYWKNTLWYQQWHICFPKKTDIGVGLCVYLAATFEVPQKLYIRDNEIWHVHYGGLSKKPENSLSTSWELYFNFLTEYG